MHLQACGFFSISICDVLDLRTRTAGRTTRAGAGVGGIEKNHVARIPAPEMTAVDFQSMLEKNTAILTFRSGRPAGFSPGLPFTFLACSEERTTDSTML
jgi:hypothetical protein